MAQKLNRVKAKLNSKGELDFNKSELAGCYEEIRKDTDDSNTSADEDVELIVLSVKKQNNSQSKIEIADNKSSQVEFLSKKLNLDENSTFLLLNSFGAFKHDKHDKQEEK
ncbi:MAG: hypothetical protein J0M18_12840 [Ignavibacteria bacterium]|nr:hypothetical protein [Ignavibacteria bacterium]